MQYRKCGCKRASTSHRPETVVEFPGSGVLASSHWVNYENRPASDRKLSAIKFWVCKNDLDADVARDSGYPAYNEMLMLDESDTDSNTPQLVDPMEIQPGGQETDSEFMEIPNPGDLQELAISHAVLVGSELHPNNRKSRQELSKSNTNQSSSSRNIRYWGYWRIPVSYGKWMR